MEHLTGWVIVSVLSLLALAALVSIPGCGGQPEGEDTESVQVCHAYIRPRVLACLPQGYDGMQVGGIAKCLAETPDLVEDIRYCRDAAPKEFARLSDMNLGHQVARLLDSI